VLLEEFIELIAADSGGQLVSDEVLIVDLCKEFFVCFVGYFIVASVLIVEEDLGLYELGLAVALAANLKEPLVVAVGPKKTCEREQGQIAGKIRVELSDKSSVRIGVNSRIIIQAMCPSRRVPAGPCWK